MPLLATALAVWLAGAAYCHGYERLLTGLAQWQGSFLWSAVAVLPWLLLFEWSKSRSGSAMLRPLVRLLAALAAVAILSLLLERLSDALLQGRSAPLQLSLMRRLPAMAACLMLILLARHEMRPARPAADSAGDIDLHAIAGAIDWVEAADNYIELHSAGRTSLKRMTITQAEKALAPHGFVRIHRRYLVPRTRISGIVGGARRARVLLVCGAELPVGALHRSRLAPLISGSHGSNGRALR